MTIQPRTVDEYLVLQDKANREMLTTVREAILSSAPKAEELISYRVPTYRLNGPLVHFAAFKNHCSLVVVNKDIISTFAKELRDYKTSGTTIHFTKDHPLPSSLVKKIVKLRIQQNQALKKTK